MELTRREFLRTASAVAAGALALPALSFLENPAESSPRTICRYVWMDVAELSNGASIVYGFWDSEGDVPVSVQKITSKGRHGFWADIPAGKSLIFAARCSPSPGVSLGRNGMLDYTIAEISGFGWQ